MDVDQVRVQEKVLGEVSGQKRLAPKVRGRKGAMSRPRAWSWGADAHEHLPGLLSKAETSPGDLPMGTCRSYEPWGPAGEETSKALSIPELEALGMQGEPSHGSAGEAEETQKDTVAWTSLPAHCYHTVFGS